MSCKIRFLVACFSLVSSNLLLGIIDLDGNGLSDLWETQYNAVGLSPSVDSDLDGFNNLLEMESGTDPQNPYSRLEILSSVKVGGDIHVFWESISEQLYQIELSTDMVNWVLAGEPQMGTGGLQEAIVGFDVDAPFCRIRVLRNDADGDGLSFYEERMLGLNPENAYTDGGDGINDAARVALMLKSGEEFAYGQQLFTGSEFTRNDAVRFLHHATLGADSDEVDHLLEIGIEAWIEEQFSMQPGLIEPEIDDRLANDLDTYLQHKRHAWWRQIMTGDDLLRQRVATVMSEIYVISDDVLENQVEGMPNYYDMLLSQAFGNWRDLIADVSLHPMMGLYLSHMKNQKPVPEENQYPDENYAREIMQLFSIGLFELNQDGSRKKDSSNEDIPSYDIKDITAMARVFTGWSWGGPDREDNDVNVPWHFYWGEEAPDEPMKNWAEQHDEETKILLNGVILPSFDSDPLRTAQTDFDDTMDMLFNHENVGPFIGKLMIQRLVKSNPSPAYIRRVSIAFENNGQGVRGDLAAVTKAILLDPEARMIDLDVDPTSGRLREPYLAYVRVIKTFEASSQNNTFNIGGWSSESAFGQLWMSSSSVFNFFLPDHQPLGALSDNGLVAPEFQVLNGSTSIAGSNAHFDAITWGLGDWTDEGTLRLNLSTVNSMTESVEVFEHFNELLTAGTITQGTRDIVLAGYEALPDWMGKEEKIRHMLYYITLSADYAVIK